MQWSLYFDPSENPIRMQAAVLVDVLRVWFELDHHSFSARLAATGTDPAIFLKRVRQLFRTSLDRRLSTELISCALQLFVSTSNSQSKLVPGPSLVVSEFLFVHNFESLFADALYEAVAENEQSSKLLSVRSAENKLSIDSLHSTIDSINIGIDDAVSAVTPKSTSRTASIPLPFNDSSSAINQSTKRLPSLNVSDASLNSPSSSIRTPAQRANIVQALQNIPNEVKLSAAEIADIYALYKQRWTVVYQKYKVASVPSPGPASPTMFRASSTSVSNTAVRTEDLDDAVALQANVLLDVFRVWFNRYAYFCVLSNFWCLEIVLINCF
jgi:hypothetical protein